MVYYFLADYAVLLSKLHEKNPAQNFVLMPFKEQTVLKLWPWSDPRIVIELSKNLPCHIWLANSSFKVLLQLAIW